MKIKAEYIGTEIRMRGKRWKISEGNEAEYQEACLLFIFEPKKPKIKKNATDKEESSDNIDSDGHRDADLNGTILAL